MEANPDRMKFSELPVFSKPFEEFITINEVQAGETVRVSSDIICNDLLGRRVVPYRVISIVQGDRKILLRGDLARRISKLCDRWGVD